eukprot:129268_1
MGNTCDCVGYILGQDDKDENTCNMQNDKPIHFIPTQAETKPKPHCINSNVNSNVNSKTQIVNEYDEPKMDEKEKFPDESTVSDNDEIVENIQEDSLDAFKEDLITNFMESGRMFDLV